MSDVGHMQTLAYITLFAPLIACVVITLATQKFKLLSAWIAILGIGGGLVCSVLMALDVFSGGPGVVHLHRFVWLEAGGITMDFGVQVDALSVLMSLIVGIVGLCVFVYSTAYIREDDGKPEAGYSRYFACISLFAFSMLGIVFSTNLVQTFIFWELVGVSSYSLIGYYFHKPSAVDAGKKAFLTNRIGDFGMTCGILLLFFTIWDAMGSGTATFSFVELKALFQPGMPTELAAHSGKLGLAAFLIFTGAIAKSAQVPLHVWLPDAMEGPTPVSALMHAATMVAAGVYMGARIFFMLEPFPDTLHVIAWIGGITALLAALMAFVQFDVKKVLAYSTLSQLGYMVMALGLFGPAAAMFHLMTHAFFKALLFLGAGSVIHGCHHEQDMRHMGGLRKTMPITAATFFTGTLALAGVFPLAGFWSKDAILGAASVETGSMPLYAIGLAVALMTAAYMGRACFMTFFGEYRGHGHPHESPPAMTMPLVLLALLAVGAGFVNIPSFSHAQPVDPAWLDFMLMGSDTSGTGAAWFDGVKFEYFHWSVAIGGTVAALAGLVVSYLFYGSRKFSADNLVVKIKPLHTLIVKGYYFDDFYAFLVQGVQQRFARLCAWFEKNVLIEWIVNNVARIHCWIGGQVRLLLDGHLHRYVTLALLGAVFILVKILIADGGDN